MDKLIKGVLTFQRDGQKERQDLFDSLANSQAPQALFITCSDSRIDPNLITATDPGDIFVCRNAGNIIPPHSAQTNGMAASIEYAVTALEVRHIIVCGHNGCGAMKGVLDPEGLEGLPQVRDWLAFAAAAAVKDKTGALSAEEQLKLTVRANVLLQLSHLKTHPSVASRLTTNEITLHGWVYDIKTGAIDVYNTSDNNFIPFKDFYDKSAPVPERAKASHINGVTLQKGIGHEALKANARPSYEPTAAGICAYIRDYVQSDIEVKPSHFLTADLGISGTMGPHFIEDFRKTFNTDFSTMTLATYFDCQKTEQSARHKVRRLLRSKKSKEKNFIDLRIAHLITAVEKGAWSDTIVNKRRPDADLPPNAIPQGKKSTADANGAKSK